MIQRKRSHSRVAIQQGRKNKGEGSSRIPNGPKNRKRAILLFGLVLFAIAILISSLTTSTNRPSRARSRMDQSQSATNSPLSKVPDKSNQETRYFKAGLLTMVWDAIKPDVRSRVEPSSIHSNISKRDYAGAESCAECHKKNYAEWTLHPHRKMNALANEQTIPSTAFDEREIEYRGGVGRFYREGIKFMMRFDRNELHRVYEISQTIGSRYYQYYVGKGIEGPESKEHDFYRQDHVLPFGYWLDRNTWVPIVHVAPELEEGRRWESTDQLKPNADPSMGVEQVGASRGVFDHTVDLALIYANSCNTCHTTFPLADMFVRAPDQIGRTLPVQSLFELSSYVAKNHPNIFDGSQPPETFPSASIEKMTSTFISFDAREKGVTLGVSCEACHLGCSEHAKNPNYKPPFVAVSPNLLHFQDASKVDSSRNHANANAICARCHVGDRPKWAAGMATWNSTEYTDAMKGSCYSQLSCIDCHDPHKPTGKVWPKRPEEDDASCIRCHEKWSDPIKRQLHTHHASGSTGDRCMNCHMPHINEGLQTVVRTHAIFSPTNSKMLLANQPNACNLCHLDKPIDWTLGFLEMWYGKTYPEDKISAAYSNRTESVGLGWLHSSHEPTRLTAAFAFAQQKAEWGIPAMINLLDDPYLLNRQFAQTSLEQLLGIQLDQKFGYWYYMDREHRKLPLDKIREEIRR